MPIWARDSTTTGSDSVHGEVFRLTMRRPEHSGASHIPSPSVSYADWRISSIAASRSPAEFGVAYGSYSSPVGLPPVMFGGWMCVAMSPLMGPPQAWRIPALSITRFTAFRTWMSSNGGVVRFIVMYQVRSSSPDLRSGSSSGSVE
jgi:hypothetical protein